MALINAYHHVWLGGKEIICNRDEAPSRIKPNVALCMAGPTRIISIFAYGVPPPTGKPRWLGRHLGIHHYQGLFTSLFTTITKINHSWSLLSTIININADQPPLVTTPNSPHFQLPTSLEESFFNPDAMIIVERLFGLAGCLDEQTVGNCYEGRRTTKKGGSEGGFYIEFNSGCWSS